MASLAWRRNDCDDDRVQCTGGHRRGADAVVRWRRRNCWWPPAPRIQKALARTANDVRRS
jgi:hypothetical protein